RREPGSLPPRLPYISSNLSFEQKLYDLRRDCRCALVQLLVVQIRDRVRHRDEAKIRKPPRARHGAAGGNEHVRDDRSAWYAVLFENDTVEHTARRARPSITDAGDDHVARRLQLLENLRVRRGTRAFFPADDVRFRA